jgi:hypothetical protein
MVELVPKIISNVATELVEATNLNSIEQARRSGRAVIIKRRNVLGDGLAKLANAYFEKAGLHIRFLVDASDWQRREIESYNLLNGDTFKARPLGDRGIVEDKLPGRSIWDRTSLPRCISHMMSAGQPYSGGGGDIRTRIANGRGDADSFHAHAHTRARVRAERSPFSGRIGLEDGRILPADYRQFARGYAVTSYGSQGKTVDHVLLSDSAVRAATSLVLSLAARSAFSVRSN